MIFVKRNIRYFLLIVAMATLSYSCSKMDHFKNYITDGEIIYTGKVDSVKVYPGNNRIMLTMLLISDPKINRVKIYWNDKNNSAEQSVTRTAGVDTVKFELKNVPEATYTFEIYTFDKDGHSSIKTEIIGTVYGEKYTNSLFNRAISSVTYLAGSKARLIWYGPSAQTIGEQIKYTDSLGANINFIEPVYKPNGLLKDTTILTNFKKLNNFQYRTLYKPVPNALDTFYSQYQNMQVL